MELFRVGTRTTSSASRVSMQFSGLFPRRLLMLKEVYLLTRAATIGAKQGNEIFIHPVVDDEVRPKGN
jgi:hypothetical protein